MAKRRRYYSREDDFERAITGLAFLVILSIGYWIYKNPQTFGAYLVGGVCLIGAIYFLKEWIAKKHFEKLLSKLKDSGEEENLKIFINRFGLEGGKGEGYSFRNHKFDWDRINDLKKIYKEKDITSNDKDVFALLRFYIQEKEESFTRESINKTPQNLANLSGSDFEKLLYRLFEAIGYKVQLTGRSGDQGGDLVAIRDGDRVLIQAKAYRDWSTGNDAVQQVVGAMKYYDCNRAVVVTTSHFTKEAIVLAKANNTELVSKEQLQEYLLKYLKESWF